MIGSNCTPSASPSLELIGQRRVVTRRATGFSSRSNAKEKRCPSPIAPISWSVLSRSALVVKKKSVLCPRNYPAGTLPSTLTQSVLLGFSVAPLSTLCDKASCFGYYQLHAA